MLISLFMALFGIGALYFIVGVGDAVIYRRIMQDAADAGAQSASVTAAKGMNLHVLLNIVMAVTAGILLVIRSVEVLLEIVLAILHALASSVVLAAKALPLIGVLTPAEQTVERVGDAVEEFVRVAHDALDVAHDVVQRGYPALAQASAIDVMVSERAYEPPVVAGFVVPALGPRLPDGGRGLPVEDDDLGLPCDRAADGLSNRLSNVSSKVPRWLLRFLGGAVGRALRLGKRRTCAEHIVEPPRRVVAQREDESRVWLGHEEFQYRSYDIGEDPTAAEWQRGARGVRIARGGRDDGRDRAAAALSLGRFGFAQSEYYFHGVDGPSQWMWKQRWRARLRRFRIPRSRVPREILGACAGARGGVAVSGLPGLCDVVRDFTLNAVSAH